MKQIKMIVRIFAFLFFLLIPVSGVFAALTPNHSYTVAVDGISSSGSITSINISAQATSDSSGILAFSLTGSTIPTNTEYNFLLVSIRDDATTIRRAIIPAPEDGAAINLGISPMTESQTEALLNVMASEGTDNPMLVLFGSLVIRSGAFGDATINVISSLIGDAIMGDDGFHDFLISKVGTVSTDAFYTAIIGHFGEYTAKLKQAVESASTLESKNFRAEAASLLSSILVESANTAGFDSSVVIAAMKASSDRMEYFNDHDNISDEVTTAIDMIMIVNDLKLQADALKNRYLSAMDTLAGSTSQMDRVSDAVEAFTESLVAAFQSMEEIFEDEESFNFDPDDIEDRMQDIQQDIAVSFSEFTGDMAATEDEIEAMRSALGIPDDVPDGTFKYRTTTGHEYYWPITTVTALNWLNTNFAEFTYTRNNTPIPSAYSWLPDRTNYTAFPYDNMPALLQNMFGLKQDLEILYFQRCMGEIAASYDIVMPPADRAEFLDEEREIADADDAGKVEWFESQDDNDDGNPANDPDITIGYTLNEFNHLNDLAPCLTAYELQVLDEWYLYQETDMKDQVDNATGITDDQLQAVFDALKNPDID